MSNIPGGTRSVRLPPSFLALFAVSFLLPFYLEELRGYSTLQAGLLLTPLALTIAVIAPFSGALAGAIFASLGGSAAGRQLAANQVHPTLSHAQISLLQQAFANGFHTAFIVLAGIAAVGVFTSLVRGKEVRKRDVWS